MPLTRSSDPHFYYFMWHMLESPGDMILSFANRFISLAPKHQKQLLTNVTPILFCLKSSEGPKLFSDFQIFRFSILDLQPGTINYPKSPIDLH